MAYPAAAVAPVRAPKRLYLRNLHPLLLLVGFPSVALGRGVVEVAAVALLGGGGGGALAGAVAVAAEGANGSLGTPETTLELNNRRKRLEGEHPRWDRSIAVEVRIILINQDLALSSQCSRV